MPTQSWAENIAHSAMYTYKGGEPNCSPGTSVSYADAFFIDTHYDPANEKLN
jgi:hypothetical protein